MHIFHNVKQGANKMQINNKNIQQHINVGQLE